MFTLIALLAAQATTPPEPRPPERSFFSSSGRGLWAYHMQTGSCAELRYHIGRNGVNGSWTMPFDAARWALGPAADGGQASVALACADATACITHRVGFSASEGVSRVTRRAVPFETEEGARSFVARLDRLRRTCAAGS